MRSVKQHPCPVCGSVIRLSDDGVVICPGCRTHLSIRHTHVTACMATSYLCGAVLALPAYHELSAFVFAILANGFLCFLLMLTVVYPRLPIQLIALDPRATVLAFPLPTTVATRPAVLFKKLAGSLSALEKRVVFVFRHLPDIHKHAARS